jgi:hypothetical protein
MFTIAIIVANMSWRLQQRWQQTPFLDKNNKKIEIFFYYKFHSFISTIKMNNQILVFGLFYIMLILLGEFGHRLTLQQDVV